MYCHAPQEAVFFTRYMGDYTARPESFESLPVGVLRGGQGANGIPLLEQACCCRGCGRGLQGAAWVASLAARRRGLRARHANPRPPLLRARPLAAAVLTCAFRTGEPRRTAPLQARAKGGDVFQLDEVGGYFDDREHYKYIK